MRNYLLGILALVLAVGLSAYTKPDTAKSKQAVYYFQASNSETDCANVTLTFPSTTPTTSPTNCNGSSKYCWIGFSGYVQLEDGTYHPSNTVGGSEVFNYCTANYTLKP